MTAVLPSWPRQQKYRNKRTTVANADGTTTTLDSKKEARRWAELQLLARAGEIVGLERQPNYTITINGRKVCDVRPDFRYATPAGAVTIEDVKSPATRKNPTYRLKKKLFEAVYAGLTITEV